MLGVTDKRLVHIPSRLGGKKKRNTTINSMNKYDKKVTIKKACKRSTAKKKNQKQNVTEWANVRARIPPSAKARGQDWNGEADLNEED